MMYDQSNSKDKLQTEFDTKLRDVYADAVSLYRSIAIGDSNPRGTVELDLMLEPYEDLIRTKHRAFINDAWTGEYDGVMHDEETPGDTVEVIFDHARAYVFGV